MKILWSISLPLVTVLPIVGILMILAACQTTNQTKSNCHELNNLAISNRINNFSKSIFFLSNENGSASISDEYNKVYLVCDRMPEKIVVEQGIRIVTFKDSIYIKSDKSSIYIDRDGGKIGGYMGAPFGKESRNFKVNASGEINYE